MSSMIKEVKIYGERSCGTNYLASLVQKNFEKVTVNPQRYGWKHGFINFKKLPNLNNDNTLFIFISKDPYSWIVSMKKKPHHAPQLYNLPLEEFVRQEWACYKGENYGNRDLVNNPLKPEEEMLNERNPITKERFENVIAMRNAKNKCFLKLRNHVKHYRRIKYENLLKHPERSIKKIAEEFSIPLKDQVENTTGYFGRNPKVKFSNKSYYLNKEYLKFYSKDLIEYVNQYLDESIESRLQYSLITQ